MRGRINSIERGSSPLPPSSLTSFLPLSSCCLEQSRRACRRRRGGGSSTTTFCGPTFEPVSSKGGFQKRPNWGKSCIITLFLSTPLNWSTPLLAHHWGKVTSTFHKKPLLAQKHELPKLRISNKKGPKMAKILANGVAEMMIMMKRLQQMTHPGVRRFRRRVPTTAPGRTRSCSGCGGPSGPRGCHRRRRIR